MSRGVTKADGEHVIAVNEKILEDGNRDGFIDTVRHELAHVVIYEMFGSSQGHNERWKRVARRLGADDSSTHRRRDHSDEYEYYISCPNCGMQSGKRRLCKTIKKPYNRRCTKCGESSLVSHDAHKPIPEENGTVDVDRLKS
jgi:Uncharacterized protein conserved in bacteria